jgi:hypothetical protein
MSDTITNYTAEPLTRAFIIGSIDHDRDLVALKVCTEILAEANDAVAVINYLKTKFTGVL